MRLASIARLLAVALISPALVTGAGAQERAPWQQGEPYTPRGGGEVYRPPSTPPSQFGGGYGAPPPGYAPPPVAYAPPGYPQGAPPYRPPSSPPGPAYGGDVYRGPQQAYSTRGYEGGDAYRAPQSGDPYRPPAAETWRGPGADAYRPPPPGYDPYRTPPPPSAEPYDRTYGARPDERGYDRGPGESYSENEILSAGHRFFGSVSQGLASVVEYAFKSKGRPNGYILGEDAGGAFVAGLRYGEGVLHTKDAGQHKVYWQGPSVGYDFGAEGSKVMVLVYNLRDPSEIYRRFGGVQGSAYLVGGVGIQFQTNDQVTLAPIRSGLGLRLGANVGYLKYTRSATWNPF